jgi:hypothetical protein
MVLATPDSSAMICWVRSATVTACSVGSANVSSIELVWSDCVPPRTPESAWRATRTTLFIGCCAVSVHPAVWVWNRSFHEFSSFAWNRSRMMRAHIRRAARYFAISSKKSMWALKKYDSRGANLSTGIPASIPAWTYAIPSAIVKASSWTAVDPASLMWYPLMLIVFHLGTLSAQ